MRDFDGESWGYTVIEAMSAKKLIIATNAIGCTEELIENNKNGFIVEHNNVEKLKETLDKVISLDNTTKKIICKNARETYKSISWSKNFKIYKKAIESAYVHD